MIRIFLFLRLGLVQLLIPLYTKKHISLIKTTLGDTLTSLQDSDGGVIPVSEVHESPRFMIFLIMLLLSGLIIQPVFQHIILILLPGSIMMSALHRSPFMTILNMLFLLVKLAFMTILTSLCLRFSNNLLLACPSLHPP